MNKYTVSAICIAMLSTGCGGFFEKNYYPQGTQGPKGDQGEPGQDGAPGAPGADGQDGQDAILEVIDPCGDAAGVIDEILIRLTDGRVLCSFSANANGQNTRLSVLPAGSYVTTDGSNCHFTVTAQGAIQ